MKSGIDSVLAELGRNVTQALAATYLPWNRDRSGIGRLTEDKGKHHGKPGLEMNGE